MGMPACPICDASVSARFRDTPYWTCPNCDCWFQSPWESESKDRGKSSRVASETELMSDHDKAVNRALAEHLFANCLRGKPSHTLDVGCNYPYFAHCFRELGCEAFGIDVIEIPPEHSRSLGVTTFSGNVATLSKEHLLEHAGTRGFELITLIHSFQHMGDPLGVLRKLRGLVTAEGRVFIRLPDHGVNGFERFFTPEYGAVHPFFYSLAGVLELLVQGAGLFSLEQSWASEGFGQRDLVLRPLERKPVVFAGMIVKNEERDLPRCLRSIEKVIDGAVVVDTGSTDATLAVAASTIAKPVFVQTYTGASRKDEHGEWKLWDFGRARNVFVEEIERRGADYVLWMDADDDLLTPANLLRATYWDEFDVFGVQIESSGQRWTHHRLWKTGLGIRYEGRCHEYPTIGGHRILNLADSVIRHDATPGRGESANARNLRILQQEFAERPTARSAFYLGSTHKDGARWGEAIEWYAKRIAMGEGYRDEWLFAYLYKARCERASGDAAAAERTLLEAVSRERGWAEFWMELAYIAYEQRRYTHAIGYSLQAADAPIPSTQLWREPDKYIDQPPRLISWSYENLSDNRQALLWALRAREKIGVNDSEWNARIQRLAPLAQT